MSSRRHDVVIVGGGHNALVAATLLARAGRDVVVLERLTTTGGAAVSARPFAGHDARLSRYSYLVSLFPDALLAELGLDLELRSRPVASYTPYPGGGLLVTDDDRATAASFRALTGGDAEHRAWTEFYAEVADLAHVVAPSLLDPLPRRGDLARRVPPTIWTDLVERPVGEAIERRFTHDLVRGVVGTDALIGTAASLHDPSLVQNRCFVYHLIGNGTGEWRVPVGGMGAVTDALLTAAGAAGARIETGVHVDRIEAGPTGATARSGDRAWSGDWLLSGVAPWTLAGLTGDQPPPKPAGSQLKVNLLLSRLPALRNGDDPAVAFAGTFHVDETCTDLEAAHATARAGGITATGELYCHTLTDRSILGPDLAASTAQTLTYFGLHVSADALRRPGATEEAYRAFLAAFEAHLAEPIEPLILGVEARAPHDLEESLGMPGGHIFHGDLSWPWLDDDEPTPTPAHAWGVATSHDRVLMCGSGARRGGAVSGIAGRDAAMAILDFTR